MNVIADVEEASLTEFGSRAATGEEILGVYGATVLKVNFLEKPWTVVPSPGS